MYISIASYDGKAYYFEKWNNTPLWNISAENSMLYADISADGRYVSAASHDNKFYFIAPQREWHAVYNYTYSGDHWQANLTFAPDAPLTNYTFRLRFRDPQDGVSDWFYPNATVRVKNRPPTATIDSITPSPAYDTQRVSLVGNGSDLDGSLTEFVWYSDIDGLLALQAAVNVTGLTPGVHNLTFRVRDSDGAWSANTTANLTVLVNELPNATALNFTVEEVFRGQNITLYANGTDDNTAESGLAVEIEYHIEEWRSDGVTTVEYIDDYWRIGFTPPYGAPTGDCTFRLRFTDEYEGRGNWTLANDTLLVRNNLPEAVIDIIAPSPTHTTSNVSFSGHGLDLEGVVATCMWMSDLDGLLSSELSFVVGSLTEGVRNLTFRVRDADGGWSANATASLTVLPNEVPGVVSLDFSRSSLVRGEYLTIFANGSDDISPEENLTPQLEYYDLGWRTGYLSNLSYVGDHWEAEFMAPLNASLGSRSFRLRFRDEYEGLSAWHDASSAVYVWNRPPVAVIESVEPLLVSVGDRVNFTAHGTDIDGTIAIYRWRSSLDGSLSAVANFSTTGLSVGNHTLYFSAADNDGNWSAEQAVNITVNARPVAEILTIEPSPVLFDTAVNLAGQGSDAEGGIVAYRWTSDIDGFLSDRATFNVTNLSFGHHLISFKVRDSSGAWSLADTAQLHVNLRPVVEIDPATVTVAIEGRPVWLNGTGNDEDGEILEYRWYSDRDGELGVTGDGTLLVTDLSDGEHNLTFRVRDFSGAWSLPAMWTLRVTPRPVLVLTAVSPQVLAAGADVTFEFEVITGEIFHINYLFVRSGAERSGQVIYQSTMPFSTVGFVVGNYTAEFVGCDDDDICSLPAITWFRIMEPLTATIADVVVERSGGVTAVTLRANDGQAEGITTYQWRSDEGLLGEGRYLVLTNLSEGYYNFSLRVRNEQGLWSEWESYSEQVYVAATTKTEDENSLPFEIPDLPCGSLVIVLAVAALAVGGGTGLLLMKRRGGSASRAPRLSLTEPLCERLRDAVGRYTEAGLPPPENEFDRVMQGLAGSDHHQHFAAAGALEARLDQRLNRYHEVIALSERATDLVQEPRARPYRQLLDNARTLLTQRRLKEAMWAFTGYTKLVEAALGQPAEGSTSRADSDASGSGDGETAAKRKAPPRPGATSRRKSPAKRPVSRKTDRKPSRPRNVEAEAPPRPRNAETDEP